MGKNLRKLPQPVRYRTPRVDGEALARDLVRRGLASSVILEVGRRDPDKQIEP